MEFYDYIFPIYVFLWVIGALGNVINLLVFNQKEMSESPVNLIFWWLSLGDLLELIALFLYEYNCEWCFFIDPSTFATVGQYGYLFLLNSYILFALHTFTVVLNITLAIKRFVVVRKPVQNRSRSSDRQSFQRMVVGLLIFSFGTCLSIPCKIFVMTKRENWYMYVLYWMQLFETSVRLGSLVALIIAGTMLIFAVIIARNDRQRTFNSEQITETGRKMTQINALTIIIIFMFIVSDIVMIFDGAITFLPLIYDIMGMWYYEQWVNYLRMWVILLQLPAILVNCSYSVFCYLIFSSQYRKTLRLYLSNTRIYVLSKLQQENPENYTVNVELQTM